MPTFFFRAFKAHTSGARTSDSLVFFFIESSTGDCVKCLHYSTTSSISLSFFFFSCMHEFDEVCRASFFFFGLFLFA